MKPPVLEALQRQRLIKAKRAMFKARPLSVDHTVAVILYDTMFTTIRLQRLVNETMSKDLG